jgi:hypothetical protein
MLGRFVLVGALSLAASWLSLTTDGTKDAVSPDPSEAKYKRYRDAEADLVPLNRSGVDADVVFRGSNGAATMVLLAGGLNPAQTITAQIDGGQDCWDTQLTPWREPALANLGTVTVDAQGVGTLVKTAAWSIGDRTATDIVGHRLVLLGANNTVLACGLVTA